MNKFILFFMCFLLFYLIPDSQLKAQDVGNQPNEAVKTDKTVEEKKEAKRDSKSKTEKFSIGEIVVKNKRIANIENATTTTIVTAEDIEAHSDKDLNDTLKSIPGMQTYQH